MSDEYSRLDRMDGLDTRGHRKTLAAPTPSMGWAPPEHTLWGVHFLAKILVGLVIGAVALLIILKVAGVGA